MRVILDDGAVVEIGTTEAKPTIGITDYSRRETDDFGVTTVVKRGFSRTMSVRVKVPTGEVDGLQRQLAALRAKPVQWVADDRFESLSITGFYKDLSIDLAIPPVSYCTLTIEGLAETGAFDDPGDDPATDQRASTLKLVRPAVVDDDVLVTSTVPENDYPVWSAGLTYALGNRVIDHAAHRIYESAIDGNIGHDPADLAGQWIDIGPTNRWAMFDQALGSLTEAAGSIVVTLNPVDPIDAIALLDVTATSVRVQGIGYDQSLAPAVAAGAVSFLDMPETASTLTITISGPGTVSVGTLLIGKLVGLGTTEASPTAAITDYSRKETDDFGEVTLVERAWAKRMEVRALISTASVDLVAARIANVRATPALWIGDAALESLAIYGFFKDFSIEVGENVSTLALSVEGLSTAGKVAPLVGDVSWTDIKDDDPAHPKPQDGATVGATPAERDTINGLVTGAATIDAALAAAQAAIAQAQADIAEISGAVEGDFGPLMQAINDLENEVDVVQGNITSLQSQAGQIIASIGQVGTEVDQLEDTVSTQGGYITTLQQSVTGLSGSVSTLSQTVATQGATIFTNAQAITTLQGNLATLTNTVSASSNPNIVPNGGFENGTAGWAGNGNAGAPVNGWFQAVNAAWGSYAANNTAWTGSSSLSFTTLTTGAINGIDVDSYYTLAADADIRANQTGAQAWLQFIWATPSGPQYVDCPHRLVGGGFGFDEVGYGRSLLKGTAQVPTGATGVQVSLVVYAPPGVTVTGMAWRQVKLERGQIATPYSGEATARQTYQAYADLNSSFASLETRVSSAEGSVTSLSQSLTNANGSISSLQQSVSSLNGSVSSLAQSASTQAGQISALQISVNTQGASISQNATAINNLVGFQASLTSTVSSQGAAITSLQTATSALQGNVATLTTQVSAGNPNIVPSGGFENGLTGYNQSGWAVATNYGGWGNHAYYDADVTAGSYVTFDSAAFSVEANSTYTASADLRYNIEGGAGRAYVEVLWYNGTTYLSTAFSTGKAANFNFDATGAQRQVLKNTAVSPANATMARVRITFDKQNGTVTQRAVRQIKMERGQVATAYSSEASITQSFQALSTLDTQYASLSSTVGVLGASVSTNASAISNLQGQYASLSTTVSSHGGSITTLQSTLTNLSGTVSSLSTAVSSQGSTISSLQTATSTLQGDVASLRTMVSAGATNIIPYGSFADGLAGWTTAGSWSASGALDASWGRYVSALDVHNAGDHYASTNAQPCEPNNTYTITADIDLGGASGGYAFARIVWLNSSGGVHSIGPAVQGVGGFTNDFSQRQKVTGLCPAGATQFYVQLGVEGSWTPGNVAFRQVKVVNGTAIGRFSDEATVSLSFQALSTLNTQYASLSSTVSTQGVSISTQASAITKLNGNVATLFGQYVLDVNVNGVVAGMKLANNGSATSLKFKSDVVEFVGSSTTERFELRQGTIFGYDSTGRKRYQLGNRSLT